VKRRGMMLETGSLGRDVPYGLHPELLDDPAAYYESRVLPLRDRGVESILWHRAYGEPTQGDAGQDFDTITFHLTDPRGNRPFAYAMMATLYRASIDFDLTVYLGAIWQTRMATLRNAGDFREWSVRWKTQTASVPKRARLAFDGSSNENEMRISDYLAICQLHTDRGGVLIEALPAKTAHCLHGLPAMVWESGFHSRWMQERAQYAGPITRVLTAHVFDQAVPVGTITDPLRFAADCAARGHDWYVTQQVLDITGVSFEAMLKEAG
jgi:hypothetical protein